MAKQTKSTRPLTFSSDLVRGAAALYGTQNLSGSGEIKLPGITGGGGRRGNGAEMAAAQNRVARYLDKMPGTEIDPTLWEGEDAKYIQSMAQQDRMEYSNAVGYLARYKPTDPGYSDGLALKDGVAKKYKVLADQQAILKEAIKDLPDFKDGLISNANSAENLSLTTKALTGELPKVVLPTGEIGFKTEGNKVVKLNDLPDIFPKNVSGFTKIMNIHENYYNSGEALNDVTRNMAYQKVSAAVLSGGVEGLKSLVSDYGFVVPQNIMDNIDQDPTAAYNAATESIMQLIESGANTGKNIADQKNFAKQRGRSGRSSGGSNNLYMGNDVKRLLNSIANSRGQGTAVETGKNFILPGNPAGNRYKVSWNKKDVVIQADPGEEFFDPFSGEQVTQTKMPIDQFMSLYNVNMSPQSFPDFFSYNQDTPVSVGEYMRDTEVKQTGPKNQYPLDNLGKQ